MCSFNELRDKLLQKASDTEIWAHPIFWFLKVRFASVIWLESTRNLYHGKHNMILVGDSWLYLAFRDCYLSLDFYVLPLHNNQFHYFPSSTFLVFSFVSVSYSLEHFLFLLLLLFIAILVKEQKLVFKTFVHSFLFSSFLQTVLLISVSDFVNCRCCYSFRLCHDGKDDKFCRKALS